MSSIDRSSVDFTMDQPTNWRWLLDLGGIPGQPPPSWLCRRPTCSASSGVIHRSLPGRSHSLPRTCWRCFYTSTLLDGCWL